MTYYFFFFQAEDGIRDKLVTGVQTCALPISTDAINTVPGAPESRGRDAINADFGTFHKSNKVLSFDQTTEEVDVAGDLAYERGTFTQTIQPQEGATQTQYSRYLAVWKRQPDGSWKCH